MRNVKDASIDVQLMRPGRDQYHKPGELALQQKTRSSLFI
jgi:hypothetical protein